jgi:aspartate/methionine/tyrosine aminotransferase
VHPNNPTGTLVRRDDALVIERLAAEHGLGLVVDEVFGDFLHGPCRPDRLPSFARPAEASCFVLGGLSKLALLPQLKLGWIGCYGPDASVREAVERLELIGDSFLSVSTAVQLAAPAILDAAGSLHAPARERIGRNLATLDRAIAALGPSCPLRRLPTDGGWYAMVEIPRTRSDDEWLERLVLDHGIVAHPGYLFGLPTCGTFVVGLLLEPERFEPAIERAVRCWAAA